MSHSTQTANTPFIIPLALSSLCIGASCSRTEPAADDLRAYTVQTETPVAAGLNIAIELTSEDGMMVCRKSEDGAPFTSVGPNPRIYFYIDGELAEPLVSYAQGDIVVPYPYALTEQNLDLVPGPHTVQCAAFPDMNIPVDGNEWEQCMGQNGPAVCTKSDILSFDIVEVDEQALLDEGNCGEGDGGNDKKLCTGWFMIEPGEVDFEFPCAAGQAMKVDLSTQRPKSTPKQSVPLTSLTVTAADGTVYAPEASLDVHDIVKFTSKTTGTCHATISADFDARVKLMIAEVQSDDCEVGAPAPAGMNTFQLGGMSAYHYLEESEECPVRSEAAESCAENISCWAWSAQCDGWNYPTISEFDMFYEDNVGGHSDWAKIRVQFELNNNDLVHLNQADGGVEWELKFFKEDQTSAVIEWLEAETNLPGTRPDSTCDPKLLVDDLPQTGKKEMNAAVVTLCPASLEANKLYEIAYLFRVDEAAMAVDNPIRKGFEFGVIPVRLCDKCSGGQFGQVDSWCADYVDAPDGQTADTNYAWECDGIMQHVVSHEDSDEIVDFNVIPFSHINVSFSGQRKLSREDCSL
jgi:hypothetical protein